MLSSVLDKSQRLLITIIPLKNGKKGAMNVDKYQHITEGSLFYSTLGWCKFFSNKAHSLIRTGTVC